MLNLLPTWPIAAGALLLGLAAGVGMDHTIMSGRIDRMKAAHAEVLREREVVRARDEAAARLRENEIAEKAGTTLQVKEDEKNRIAADLVAANARLQDRPNRKPAGTGAVPAAAADCKGSTGAELSRPDAEFLSGEAARANGVRAALAQCYAQYDAARAVINRSDTPAATTPR